jgi:hypothetical protein
MAWVKAARLGLALPVHLALTTLFLNREVIKITEFAGRVGN